MGWSITVLTRCQWAIIAEIYCNYPRFRRIKPVRPYENKFHLFETGLTGDETCLRAVKPVFDTRKQVYHTGKPVMPNHIHDPVSKKHLKNFRKKSSHFRDPYLPNPSMYNAHPDIIHFLKDSTTKKVICIEHARFLEIDPRGTTRTIHIFDDLTNSPTRFHFPISRESFAVGGSSGAESIHWSPRFVSYHQKIFRIPTRFWITTEKPIRYQNEHPRNTHNFDRPYFGSDKK